MEPTLIPPDQLPTAWQYDSEALLVELARIRELALHIPPTFNAQHGPINTVIDAIWRLEENVRFLLQNRSDAHTAKQQAFRDLAAAPPSSPRQTKRIDRQAAARPANARRKA
jgi:hypothetical protein